METTYFVLGMLSVFALILIGVITWGWLTINKQQTRIKNLQEDTQGLLRTISTEMDYTSRRIDTERQITDIWRGMDNKMTDSVRESNSYTDKRIDKLIDTYFDIKKNKDLLKG